MNENSNQVRLHELFILRRAFRSPGRSVTRAHMKAAFGLTDGVATGRLNWCLGRYPDKLRRIGNRIAPVLGAEPPVEAGMSNLMSCIAQNTFDFSITGLTTDELPIRCRTTAQYLPRDLSVLQRIVDAIARDKTVAIKYVTMRRGDTGVWRRIYPLGIEKVGDQLRVDAQDLSIDLAPIRSFVMTRIVDSKEDTDKLRKGFVKMAFGDNARDLAIEFSDALTEAQRDVLANEFNVRHGKIRMSARAIYEFKQFHSGSPVSDEIVNPVFSKITETGGAAR